MASIRFSDVEISFPIFNANGRSITSRLLQTATGGKLDKDPDGLILVQALRGVSFQIQAGDRVGLIGHNGAGKSTILRAMNKIYQPARGQVAIDGDVASLIDLNLGVNPEATGLENIWIRGRLLGMSKEEISRSLEEIIAFSELGEFIEMPVRTYSSGMMLRLAFSISTFIRPNIILMDEWLSVGDESFRHKAEKRLTQMIESTEILVIASHSPELLSKLCNKILWFEHGKLVAEGTPSFILPQYFKGI